MRQKSQNSVKTMSRLGVYIKGIYAGESYAFLLQWVYLSETDVII